MRIIELLHDKDHPKVTNVDFWLEESKDYISKKVKASDKENYPELEGSDLIVIHGGTQHLWNKEADPWLYKEVSYIKEALKKGIPVLGFCLGAQIIAEALGGKVYNASEKEVGWFNIEPTMSGKKHKILEGLEDGFRTFLWHSDHYELPDSSTVLGYTEAAANQIFVSNIHKAVGFQFHPEYTKENIEVYLNECDDFIWSGGRFANGKENILREVKNISSSYELFRKLINNSINWFHEF
ncbi:type 1 glutamine amidotransferase [Clostridium beijerinckii]|uniref:Glutamine amidotransferase domain-containing protein n=1 Tax=Clostridium beijerinckii TaxID=1520 RepID=A0A1S9N5S6_CLOBE|nr:type 1 glutamine amidotransferase [Clostridium beijerinckii]OOP72785.1 hypothetical protein CBEIBR21_13265 [Clostridium beijerinckii]